MLKIISKSHWTTALVIFALPIILIFFLGSQMAYSQVKSRFEEQQAIPEITQLSDMKTLPEESVVMVRGKISEASPHKGPQEIGLVVYQERPLDGREVRFREEFNLIFPQFILDLPDGSLPVLPSTTREHVIQNELHRVPVGDREYTGFRVGDTVTVQGQWQSGALTEVTGITSVNKQAFLAEWEAAFSKVRWVRNGLGLLSLLGVILLTIQIYRMKRGKSEEADTWQNPKTTTAPTASP